MGFTERLLPKGSRSALPYTGPGDRTAIPKASWLGTPVGEIVAVPGVTTGSPTASSDAIPAGAIIQGDLGGPESLA